MSPRQSYVIGCSSHQPRTSVCEVLGTRPSLVRSFRVQAEHACGRVGGRELAEYPLARVLAEPPRAFRVVEQTVESPDERIDVARRNEEAVLAVGDELGRAADGCGNDGLPLRHRLEHGG